MEWTLAKSIDAITIFRDYVVLINNLKDYYTQEIQQQWIHFSLTEYAENENVLNLH